jgi:hypothetical protein
MPHAYVTRPARRAYQTPENELLVHVLDAVARTGRDTTWFNRSTGAASIVNERVDGAEYWRQHRVLSDIQRRPVTPRTTTRVRAGRNRKPYASAIAAYELLRSLVRQLDRGAVRDVVEQRALVVTADSVLFEMMCTFAVIEALSGARWVMDRLRLIQGKLRLDATRGSESLRLWYQSVPQEFRASSRYLSIAGKHAVPVESLRPDMVLRWDSQAGRRWLIVEAKLGDVSFQSGRSVEGSARAALKDVLMYREDFSDVLDETASPYGLGVAWGAELSPREGRVMLATPDRLGDALHLWLQA